MLVNIIKNYLIKEYKSNNKMKYPLTETSIDVPKNVTISVKSRSMYFNKKFIDS